MATIGKGPKQLRDHVSIRLKSGTRNDLIKNLKVAEQEASEEASEFVEEIRGQEEWSLDDWASLADVTSRGKLFCEMRIAFTEIDEVAAATG